MISSIFGKTKPINYIILLAFLFIFYWFVHFFLYDRAYGLQDFIIQAAVLGILLFSIFVINFIVKRNQITGTNSFAILFYTLLIVTFSEVLMDNNAILCSFFLLLATRRLISLRSLKSIKFKLFDATLWITVASFFYDWALLYLFVVFVAIYFYEPKNIRNWMVPVVGVFTASIILFCILILYGNTEFITNHYTFSLNIDTTFFANLGNSTKIAIYILLILFSGFLAFLKLGKLGVGRIITMRLIAISLIIGLVLTVLKSSPTVFPILVTFFPASILLTKYVEVIKKINIKEMVLYVSVLAPFIIFTVEMIVK